MPKMLLEVSCSILFRRGNFKKEEQYIFSSPEEFCTWFLKYGHENISSGWLTGVLCESSPQESRS